LLGGRKVGVFEVSPLKLACNPPGVEQKDDNDDNGGDDDDDDSDDGHNDRSSTAANLFVEGALCLSSGYSIITCCYTVNK